MDNASIEIMKWCLKDLPDKDLEILDVGSLDINGSYRGLFSNPKWHYTGLDIVPGKNVDMVSMDPYHYPYKDESFDIVISGQCLEHVEDMYAWAEEVIRLVKKDGVLIIVVPSIWGEHRFPIDCWRIFPDGLRFLFSKRGKMQEIYINNFTYLDQSIYGLCYGVFKKNS